MHTIAYQGSGACTISVDITYRNAFNFVMKKGTITARDFSESLKLKANAGGTKLLNLHRKRLVKRIDEIRDGGRVEIYRCYNLVRESLWNW
jgi:hypothetical protein